jgi:hypothetical protein
VAKFHEKLKEKRQLFESDLDAVIKRITVLRKKLGTKSDFDKKMHKQLDEVVYKLRELQYLIGKIIELDIQTVHVTTLMAMELQFTDRKHYTRDDEVGGLLVTMGELAESFYYTAYRICKIFEKLALPFRADGVEGVKNFLAQHPEVMSRSIGSSLDGAGPILKSELVERHNTQKKDRFTDKGLYKNFEDFLTNMNWALDTHVMKTSEEKPQVKRKKSMMGKWWSKFRSKGRK